MCLLRRRSGLQRRFFSTIRPHGAVIPVLPQAQENVAQPRANLEIALRIETALRLRQ